TAGPVAVRAGADLERHLQAFAQVVARAAHLRELPARTEVARAPFGVGLEAAAGQHHGLRVILDRLALVPGAHAAHALAVVDQRDRARFVEDRDAFLLGGLGKVR